MMTPAQALDLLRRDSRNHITAMHRWMDIESESGTGCGIASITLNYHEPYYAGWGGSMEWGKYVIDYPLIQQIKSCLTVTPWGNQRLGGTIYYLK